MKTKTQQAEVQAFTTIARFLSKQLPAYKSIYLMLSERYVKGKSKHGLIKE